MRADPDPVSRHIHPEAPAAHPTPVPCSSNFGRTWPHVAPFRPKLRVAGANAVMA